MTRAPAGADPFAFWGKARAMVGEGPGSHPALHHMLDVAACAEVLLPIWAPGIPAGLRPAIVFLVALHDVGKFGRVFQALSPEHWPHALGAYEKLGGDRHDTLGYRVMTELLHAELAECLPEWPRGVRAAILAAVMGHHGSPPLVRQETRLSSKVFCGVCRATALAAMQAVRELLLPEPPPPPEIEQAKTLSWTLAGLTTLADWIGSSQTQFPYTAPMPGGAAAYWPLARRRAAAAVVAAGVCPAESAPLASLCGVFPLIEEPSPVQRWAERVPLPEGPTLALIEDVTGSGKTEAAVLLAHRLIAAGRADGLFFALPTMATADAMFQRLGAAYRRLFAPGARPSLVLAHGRRALHAGFHAAVLRGLAPDAPDLEERGEDPAGAECAAWVAEDRRLAFLADVGAGTVDQALLGVLPARHAALRLLGLSRKVLIVDEAHAYDSYMRAELAALLRFQAALGGSAIVLSATLPQTQRSALVAAFTGVAPTLEDTSYPLTTLASRQAVVEQAHAVRPPGRLPVQVGRLDDEAAALDAVLEAAAAGAAVAWVRNTVDDAIAAAAALRARGVGPLLFHARFAMVDRQRIQDSVMQAFGPDRRGGRARVLVATQVVEQSLDLDFDLMVTDLAPADLLVQRAGRIWRHARSGRTLPAPRLLVLSPDPVPDPDAGWARRVVPGSVAVYGDPALLWRSARALFAAGAIETPGGVRGLVEAAYAKEAPEGLRAAAGQAEGRQAAEGSVAQASVLKLDAGWTRGSGDWASDVATPTRLGEETTVLRLARWEGGAVVPWAEADSVWRGWALSEVSVRAAWAKEAVVPPAAEAAVALATARWPAWDTGVLLLLRPAGDGWFEGDVVSKAGEAVRVRYSPDEAGLALPSRR